MSKGKKIISKDKKTTKPTKTKDVLYIRAPESYHKDLEEISKITGVTINAICLELLRPAIKARLKELKEE